MDLLASSTNLVLSLYTPLFRSHTSSMFNISFFLWTLRFFQNHSLLGGTLLGTVCILLCQYEGLTRVARKQYLLSDIVLFVEMSEANARKNGQGAIHATAWSFDEKHLYIVILY